MIGAGAASVARTSSRGPARGPVQRRARPRRGAGRRTTATELAGFGYSGNYPGVAGPPAQRLDVRRRSAYARARRPRRHDLHAHCLAAQAERVTDLRTRVYDGDATGPWRSAKHWGYRGQSSAPSPAGSSWSSVAAPGATGRRHPRRGRRPGVPRTTTRWTRWWRRARPTRRRANNHRMTLARRSASTGSSPASAAVVSLARVDGAAGGVLLRRSCRRRRGRGRAWAYTGVDPALPRPRAGPAGQAARAPPGRTSSGVRRADRPTTRRTTTASGG